MFLHRIATGLGIKTHPHTLKIVEQLQYVHRFGLDVTVNEHSASESVLSFWALNIFSIFVGVIVLCGRMHVSQQSFYGLYQ